MGKYITGSKSIDGYTELNGYGRQYALLNVSSEDEHDLLGERLLS